MVKIRKSCVLVVSNLLFGINLYASVQQEPSDVNTYITTAKCENCDLSMFNLNSLMGQVVWQPNNTNFYVNSELKGADLVGANFYGTVLNMQNSDFDSISGSTVNFNNTKLDSSTFINAILEKATFQNAALEKANFSGADLKGAAFDGADLTGSNITQQQLSEISHCQTILPNGTIATSCTSD